MGFPIHIAQNLLHYVDGLQARRAAAAAALDRPVLVVQGNTSIASPCVSHLVLSQEIALRGEGGGGEVRIAA